MQLKQEKLNHLAGNVSEVTAFGLDNASASTIINMLTRQYSDPEMAFIRETCSNAYDAHIAADNQEVPFDLHIPSHFAPHVEIRDYGTGLSKEFMLTKYTQVGHSTKRSSNSQIGGFGIGRLSFLIVTEQAAITSYHNGMKYSYTVAYDATGQLIISLQDERETDEPNGLRLKFPVQTNRIESFRQAARKYFSRVSATMPNFTADEIVNIEKTTYSHRGDNWGLRNNTDDNTIYAIMGNIAYPVLSKTLKLDPEFEEVHDLLSSRIDLFFEIGDVIPTPPRENLDMCEQTRTSLLSALQTLRKELVDDLAYKVKTAKHLWQAVKIYEEIKQGSSWQFQGVIKGLAIEYKGVKLEYATFNFESPVEKKKMPNGVELESTLLTFYTRSKAYYSSNNPVSWNKGKTKVNSRHDSFLQYVFIYQDTRRGIRPTIDYNYKNPNSKVVLVSGEQSAWDEFKQTQLAKGFGVKNFILASCLMPKPRVAKVKDPNIMVSVLRRVLNINCSGWKSYCRYEPYSDFADKSGVLYVKASNFEVDRATRDKFREYRRFVKAGLLDEKPIVVLNKNTLELLDPKWTSLEDYTKVRQSVIDKKKKEIKQAVYIAVKYNRLRVFLNEEFSKQQLRTRTSQHYISGTGRCYTYGPTPFGRLVIGDRDVLQNLNDIRFLVSSLEQKLDALPSVEPLSTMVSRVKSVEDYYIDDAVFEDICKAYNLDFGKIKELAKTVPTARLQRFAESQLAYVVRMLGKKSEFNLKKLKKELKND